MDKQVFLSYSRKDSEFSQALATALKAEGIGVWLDTDQLLPGQDFVQEIDKAVNSSDLFIVIFSRVTEANAWIIREAELAFSAGIPIAPVVLEDVASENLPQFLRSIQYSNLSKMPPEERIGSLVREIKKVLEGIGPRNRYSHLTTNELARVMRSSIVGQQDAPAPSMVNSDRESIFVVHGHDDIMLEEVSSFLIDIGVRPIVMTKIGGAEQSLFQRFLRYSGNTKFAVVLMSADDLGASRYQYEEPDIADRALQYRTRQNVLLELGYFYGSLGWENVFVLQKPANRRFPNFERPSDLDGVVFDRFLPDGAWKVVLKERLVTHGFKLDR